MLNLVRPRYFVPVHGEYRHLAEHRAAGARRWVWPRTPPSCSRTGRCSPSTTTGARRVEPVTAGRVFVDGKGIGDISDIVLRDRRHLSQDGLLLAVLALDQHTGELIAGPDFIVARRRRRGRPGAVLRRGARRRHRDARRSLPESRTDSSR